MLDSDLNEMGHLIETLQMVFRLLAAGVRGVEETCRLEVWATVVFHWRRRVSDFRKRIL